MDNTNTTTTAPKSPIKAKPKTLPIVLALIVAAVILVGGAVGLRLVQQQQDVRQQAAVVVPTPDNIICHKTTGTSCVSKTCVGSCTGAGGTAGCGASGYVPGACPTPPVECTAWGTCTRNGTETCGPVAGTQGVQFRTCGGIQQEQYCILPTCVTTNTCYNVNSNCTGTSSVGLVCNNSSTFGSLQNCLNHYCPSGSTGSAVSSGAPITCSCTNPSTHQASTFAGAYPNVPSLPAACTSCPAPQIFLNGNCLNACPAASSGQECNQTPASGAVSCAVAGNPNVQYCCPANTHRSNGVCVADGTGGPQCVQPGIACSTATSANGNCCAGSYCTGVSGQQVCNVPADNAELRCLNAGGVCGGTGGYISFTCSGLTNGQCLSNPQFHNSFAEARNWVTTHGNCGQVDTACVNPGGAEDRNLCGSFEVISQGCGGTPQSPQPSPSPTPSPVPSPTPTPPAPVCLNITMSPAQPTIGSSVTFTCGQVSNVNHYEFRVKLPDGTIQTLAAAATGGRVSVPLSVTTAGTYKAQCRICTGADSGSCQAFESL